MKFNLEDVIEQFYNAVKYGKCRILGTVHKDDPTKDFMTFIFPCSHSHSKDFMTFTLPDECELVLKGKSVLSLKIYEKGGHVDVTKNADGGFNVVNDSQISVLPAETCQVFEQKLFAAYESATVLRLLGVKKIFGSV